MLENHYNDVTLDLDSEDPTGKEEVRYKELKDKVKFKENSKVDELVLSLKAEI